MRRVVVTIVSIFLTSVACADWPYPTPTPAPAPGCNYYVSTSGADSNPGSASRPWLHIQFAIAHLGDGQVACVAPGVYASSYDNSGNIRITSSGAEGRPKVLTAQDPGALPQIRSLWISASYWLVDHLDVSNQSNAYGVEISGNATGVSITNNYIHELCRGGIYASNATSQLTITGNRVWHAQMAGISFGGANSLVSLNEIWDTRELPWLAGGIYASCTDPQPDSCRDDADGIRFFGTGHIIRQNYIHDIPVNHASGGPIDQQAPHTDCFQTWNNHGQAAGGNILIEQNWCRWPAPYLATPADVSPWAGRGCVGSNHIASIEDATGTITWQNNVFANSGHGIIVSGSAAHHIWNNTFDHVQAEAIEVHPDTVSDWLIQSNIFFDSGNGRDGWLAWKNQSGVKIGSNDFYMRTGAPGGNLYWGGGTAPSYTAVDPQFVSTGNSTGAGSDYRLRDSSPLAASGETVVSVSNDIEGNPRLAGHYSFGAFQPACGAASPCGLLNRAGARPRDSESIAPHWTDHPK
jgi:hypothetical protein